MPAPPGSIPARLTLSGAQMLTPDGSRSFCAASTKARRARCAATMQPRLPRKVAGGARTDPLVGGCMAAARLKAASIRHRGISIRIIWRSFCARHGCIDAGLWVIGGDRPNCGPERVAGCWHGAILVTRPVPIPAGGISGPIQRNGSCSSKPVHLAGIPQGLPADRLLQNRCRSRWPAAIQAMVEGTGVLSGTDDRDRGSGGRPAHAVPGRRTRCLQHQSVRRGLYRRAAGPTAWCTPATCFCAPTRANRKISPIWKPGFGALVEMKTRRSRYSSSNSACAPATIRLAFILKPV